MVSIAREADCREQDATVVLASSTGYRVIIIGRAGLTRIGICLDTDNTGTLTPGARNAENIDLTRRICGRGEMLRDRT
jgi:hypothetical protein